MRSLMLAWIPLTALLAAGLTACGGGGGETGPMFESGKVDLEALPHAGGGCEAATPKELFPGPSMLPGRICMDCHRDNSEAFSSFTAAGTVYGSATGPCNEAGLAGVLVEILDMEGAVQTTLTTNEVGNFSTFTKINLPMRVRLSKDDKTAVMTSSMDSASCATCHQSDPESGAPGRVYLQ